MAEKLEAILEVAVEKLRARAAANLRALEGGVDFPDDDITLVDFGEDISSAERDELLARLGPKTKKALFLALVTTVRLLAASYTPPEDAVAAGPAYFMATLEELERLEVGNRRPRCVCKQWRLGVHRHEEIGLVDLCGWNEADVELGAGVLVLADGSVHAAFVNRDGLLTATGGGVAVAKKLEAFAEVR